VQATDRRPRGRFEPLEDRCLLSITPELIKDINTVEAGSNPQWLTEMGGVAYFAFEELWRTDGTAQGTRIVKDIDSQGGSTPADLTAVEDQLFFTAEDGVHGRELWVTDGTDDGTRMVKDISSGWEDTRFSELTAAGGLLYFVASDGQAGTELWRSDGTTAGTYRVRDIRPGDVGSEPRELTDYNALVVFTADDGQHGREVWLSDGTEEGTRLLQDIRQGPESSEGYRTETGRLFTVLGNDLFFVANQSGNTALMKYDGLKDPEFVAAVYPQDMAAVGDGLLLLSGEYSTGHFLQGLRGGELESIPGRLRHLG
jgi:ELWxxDGT repeat protein